MLIDPANNKRTLLMLCHGLPNADGSAAERRAWAWLTLCQETHAIWLLAAPAGEPTLGQWRAASAMTQKLSLLPSRFALTEAATTVADWQPDGRFDLMLGGPGRLWQNLHSTARERIVDLELAPPRRRAAWPGIGVIHRRLHRPGRFAADLVISGHDAPVSYMASLTASQPAAKPDLRLHDAAALPALASAA